MKILKGISSRDIFQHGKKCRKFVNIKIIIIIIIIIINPLYMRTKKMSCKLWLDEIWQLYEFKKRLGFKLWLAEITKSASGLFGGQVWWLQFIVALYINKSHRVSFKDV